MITGQTLRDAILSGANNIANQRTRVDELNVFPVPDGDTGTNMSMTIGAARADEGKTVLSITENGYGKRTPIEEYRVTGRGGLGVKNYMVTDKTGDVVGMKVVDGTEDLLLVTAAGILIRTPVENIRVAGRATQGVIVMRFKEEGDRVISLALADPEEKQPEPEEASL